MDDYPDINNPDFQFLIARKLEFRNLHNVEGLYPHQEFVRRFMSPYTPYNSLIMYHSLGSGKSIACIAVAVDHFLYDEKQCIIVTKGDSGTDNFTKQVEMYLTMSGTCVSGWKPSMKHYISLSNQICSMSDDDIVQEFSNCILVLDEVHNVRYLKHTTEKSVYGSIVRLLKLCVNVKVLIATATPMTDNPEQIHSLLGICNHSRHTSQLQTFPTTLPAKNSSYSPEDKAKVGSHSVDLDGLFMNGIVSYNSTVCDKPASTQMGTDMYIPGMKVYTTDMIGHQDSEYFLEHGVQPPDDIYRKLTHISLFCFPDGTHGRDVITNKMSETRLRTTIMSMSSKQTKEIRYLKYNILPEYAYALVGEELRKSSCKYSAVMDLIYQSEGNVFIFLEEVKGSGLLLLASILEEHGYELYLGEEIDNMSTKKRYTMCVGSSDICPNNSDRLDGFNSYLNRHGDYVKILLGSKVIGESITLKNVRQIYCITPHWNDSTVDQAIGRVVRNGSHSALSEDQRHVDIYIHAAVYQNDPYNSVDIKKLAKCKEKEKNINVVEQLLMDCAVDRYIYDDLVPITNVGNFAAAYIHHHLPRILSSISDLFRSRDAINIDSIAYALNMDITVCKEALCQIILSNTNISNILPDNHLSSWNTSPRLSCASPAGLWLNLTSGEDQEKLKFLRAHGDTVFVVDDPSLPSVMVPDAIAPSPIHSSNVQIEELHQISLQEFRYMPVKQKTWFVENCIAQNKPHFLLGMNTVYAVVEGVVCHLLLYRDLDSSYTSANPVPKKPLGKTRLFRPYTHQAPSEASPAGPPIKDVGVWVDVASIEAEKRIFNEYQKLVDKLVEDADAHQQTTRGLFVYGLISTIDGDMRLRLRSLEDNDKSMNDNRYVRRGKSMKSIKKQILLDVLSDVTGQSVNANTSINEASHILDNALVDAGMYIIL